MLRKDDAGEIFVEEQDDKFDPYSISYYKKRRRRKDKDRDSSRRPKCVILWYPCQWILIGPGQQLARVYKDSFSQHTRSLPSTGKLERHEEIISHTMASPCSRIRTLTQVISLGRNDVSFKDQRSFWIFVPWRPSTALFSRPTSGRSFSFWDDF